MDRRNRQSNLANLLTAEARQRCCTTGTARTKVRALCELGHANARLVPSGVGGLPIHNEQHAAITLVAYEALEHALIGA